ncbi:hypothetical protein TARUN_1779 [Trichoderma arundinaceum]|uniref:Uncharacterized protein n=1 Tax=Trichoderma arundinaceum TaxID=490622 RepID=A0A395NWK8_TRIAR|nr:hypothetical protein TARUN_1779 [Trichoderma arundinaceum]
MRGLTKAATLVLAPTVALTRPVPTNPTTSRGTSVDSAFAVAVAVDTSGSREAKKADQTLVFNLDIQESSEACSQAKVRIDGFLLSQDDNGTGQGTFASLDGHTVTASWNFTCKDHARRVPWDQDLAVTIMSLDGEAVPETTFVTSFRQRTPVKVYDVGGDSVIYTTEGPAPSRIDGDQLVERIKEITGLSQVDDEIKAEIKELISMEHQINELQEIIKAKQRKVMDGLGIKPSTPAFNLQTFYQTARLASSTLRGTMEHWLNSVLGLPSDRKHHRFPHHRFSHHHSHHREDGLFMSMQVDGTGGQRFFYYRDENDTTRFTPIHSRRHISYFPLFAIIFTFHLALFFVLRSIRQRIHSRRARTPSSRTSRHQQRRETRVQRRAQRQARRAGVKQSMSDFFCSIRDLFRTKHIELNEKTSMLLQEEETSMEDELASFQEAASMVSDMVAASERRASGRDEAQPPRFTEDVSPPAYDDVEHMYGEKSPDGR